MTVSAGTLEDDEAVLDWSRDLGNRTLRTRAHYVVESPDTFLLERNLSPSEDRGWQPTYRATYRRVR